MLFPPYDRTFWITRNALTKGIMKAEGCRVVVVGGVDYAKRDTTPEHIFAKIGLDAWPTEEEAKLKAAEMARARLVTLSKEAERVAAFLTSLGVS